MISRMRLLKVFVLMAVLMLQKSTVAANLITNGAGQ